MSPELAQLIEQFRRPAARYTHARFQSGKVAPLVCEKWQAIGSEPAWLASDRTWRDLNRRPFLDRPEQITKLTFWGFAQEESARLADLGYQFRARGIEQLLTADDVVALQAAGEAIAA